MLKVIDVDFVSDHTLELTFNDGYQGYADLSVYFKKAPFSKIKDFKRFSLTRDGSLNWDGNELSAATLRDITKGSQKSVELSFNVQEMEAVIKQALMGIDDGGASRHLASGYSFLRRAVWSWSSYCKGGYKKSYECLSLLEARNNAKLWHTSSVRARRHRTSER